MSEEILRYPLEKILESLGSQKGSAKNMWMSPFRQENNASLHVDPAKNVWYDHGAGIGGSSIQLVMFAKHCSAKEAVNYIASLSPALANEIRSEESSEPSIEIKKVEPLTSGYLTRYVESRKIPLNLARIYLKEVLIYSRNKERHFKLVGFPNNMGAYALSAPSGFKQNTKAAITTINTDGKLSVSPSSKRVAIFEGFFDFLSWQVMQSNVNPTCDVVVLNSVNNLEKARAYISAHDSALCFLDNDAAGQRCTTAIENMMKGKEVIDMSDLYGSHKDLNEMLQASRGYTPQMRLTPSL